jgi:Family of unknown function (DUF5343)
MADYAYTTVTGKIKPLLDKIRTVGVPSKVGTPWLKTIGFTSSNDTSLIGVLKFIGLTDQSGILRGVHSAERSIRSYSVTLSEKDMPSFSRCIPMPISDQPSSSLTSSTPAPQQERRLWVKR